RLTGGLFDDHARFLEGVAVAVHGGFESHGNVTEPSGFGRRAPFAPELHAMVAEQIGDHDREEGGDAAAAAVLADHRVIVLEQLEPDVGNEVLGVGTIEAIPAAEGLRDAIDDLQVAEVQELWIHSRRTDTPSAPGECPIAPISWATNNLGHVRAVREATPNGVRFAMRRDFD